MLMRRVLSSALLGLAVLALGSIAQPVAAAQAPTADPAQQAAEAARLAAETAAQPLTLADFVGRWENHNYLLRISPDGTASMIWRRGGAGVESGLATLSIE